MRRLASLALLLGLSVAPAHAQGTELMPGVTYEKVVQFTPHGPVALQLLTAPKPGDQGGLYQLAPVLSEGLVTGTPETVTQLERSVSTLATVAGINGDLTARDATPAGMFLSGGQLVHPPASGRSSIGIDGAGGLHVDRVRFFGTWKGTGQRRPLDGLNRSAGPGQVVLFTPAYGATVPRVTGSAEVTLLPFPSAVPNSDLTAPVTGAATGGGEPIPPGGAVLQATGGAAAKLQAEAPAGTAVTVRLILQPAWEGVVSALGGGPALVRNGRAIFRSGEDFTNDLIASRSPRAGVGQLADGRIILAAVDGGQPGYSAGMTSYELAQTMQRLGAVNAAAVAPGADVQMAFDGALLNRPAIVKPVREALLVQYFGVYAPPLLPLLNSDPSRSAEPFAYKLVRPSKVTAELIAPDGTPRVIETDTQHDPGLYPATFSAFDSEGTWHWHVVVTDDLGRMSTADRPFRYDATLTGLTVPKTAREHLAVRFLLSRPAKVGLRIETRSGVQMRALAPVSLQSGAAQLTWDGTLPQGTRAYSGSYVAQLSWSSAVGTSDLSVPFGFRR